MMEVAKVVCFVFCFGSTGDLTPASDFCEVMAKTFREREIRFTAEELASMTRENKVRLRALKQTYIELCKGIS